MQEENILKFIKPVFLSLFGFDAWSEVLVEPAYIVTLYATRRFCQLSFQSFG